MYSFCGAVDALRIFKSFFLLFICFYENPIGIEKLFSASQKYSSIEISTHLFV